jgi:hypothetical protein
MRAPLCDTSSLAVRLEVSIFGGLYIWRASVCVFITAGPSTKLFTWGGDHPEP